MQFTEGAQVFTADHEVAGKITHVVFDPITKEATHVVVRHGWLFTEDKVIPLDWFTLAEPERAILNEDIEDFESLPRFEEKHYVPSEVHEVEGMADYREVQPLYAYPPMGGLGGIAPYTFEPIGYISTPEGKFIETTDENIPDNTVAVEKGAEVLSVDGDVVGHIESFIVDGQSHLATHVIISQGLLVKNRKLLPISWFSVLGEDQLRLSVSNHLLETLPDYED